MSTLKTIVNDKEVLIFLQNSFDKNISSVTFIKGGETSQAFFFNSNNKDFVIRVNSKKYSFEKDKFAYQHFGSSIVPIPKILKIGMFDAKYYYAISEKAKGKDLDNFNEKMHRRLLPQLISILDHIHRIKIDISRGKFGYWDGSGKTTFDSWKAFMLNYEDDVNSNWNKLYKNTFLEKNVVNKVCERIKELAGYLPVERFLVHGDYGFNNVISDGERITGVLDWGESMYGDFLYDVAWLEFYSSGIRYGEIFKKHYLDIGIKIPNYKKRLLCYQLYLGINGLGFFALSGQHHNYMEQKNKLLLLLNSDS